MKKRLLMLLASGLVLASAANATPVARSASITLTVKIQSLPGIVITGNATTGTGGLTVDTATGSMVLAAGVIAQTAPITIPVTATTSFASLRATGVDNLTGLFSIGGGLVTATIPTEIACPSASPPALGIACIGASGLGGQMSLSGTIFPVVVPMLATVPIPLNALGIGHGGFVRIPNTPAGFLFDAAPWTQGVAKIGLTATSKTTWMGSLMGIPLTVTYTMSWATVASATGAGGTVGTPNSGTITLVSPVYVSALGNVLPTFATLQIHFIPEPGTFLLLGAGLGGIALLRRRRR